MCAENVGAISITGVASRRVTQAGAAIMILVSVVGKIGALFASIPQAVSDAAHGRLGLSRGPRGEAADANPGCSDHHTHPPLTQQLVAGVFTVMFSIIAGVSTHMAGMPQAHAHPACCATGEQM